MYSTAYLNGISTVWMQQGTNNTVMIDAEAVGQKIAALLNEQMSAGYHQVEFNSNNLASGIYFYRMQAGSYVETKKLLLLK